MFPNYENLFYRHLKYLTQLALNKEKSQHIVNNEFARPYSTQL